MRRSTPRYEIIFIASVEDAPVVMHTALSADEATLLFAVELQRLLANRSAGELAIRRKTSNSAKTAVIVRQAVTAPSP